jgi:hypothetical protein
MNAHFFEHVPHWGCYARSRLFSGERPNWHKSPTAPVWPDSPRGQVIFSP